MPRCARLALLLLLAPLLTVAESQIDRKACDTATSIPFANAASLAINKVDPEMPPLAKSLRLNGVVKVEVCVSDTGDVLATKLISGHPVLVGAAVESAKKWRFKAGQAPFKTVLEIPLTNGSSAAAQAEDDKINSKYFAAEDRCREDLRGKDNEAAILSCSNALTFVEKLPPERANERRIANELVGHAYFRQQRFDDALRYYKRELDIALQSLHDYDAELAYALHDVALASHALGRVSDAKDDYEKAELTLSHAIDHIGMEELKRKYAETLRQIREHHLVLLRQTGQTAAAADLEQRMKAVPY
jgi:tetratricopeptide (TPR) repeat protein